ncbi:acyltransferase family protein [Flavobacterium columnare]|uniref:Acyltransferase n=1 Tax=Flavobacterium columnare TaxID=996 RepID=A0AAJ3ZJX9_9FLAO|nr:acyltransferase [Flavobacterium columnare]QCV57064.1 acyltransferase [Flavobacterium columnare]QOG55938.1 acyltransferase [Flavobacterium columnare]QOG58660.1 acyltransferase [Flavobacterium columnare]QOG61382.1 acyltransferase [Flavobacterium columnare]QOG64105.1 acyltransferase [Flavobacterium columnare]
MRNNNLDVLKIIMAFLVIALHIFPVSKATGIEGLISYEIASGITRIAVPTFFLISGYFLRNKLNDKPYLWKYTKRILLLYVVWQFIYLPDLIRFYNLGWFSKSDMILKLIYGYWHLWYLLATTIAVGLLYLLRNLSTAIKTKLILFLLILGYSFQIGIQSNRLDLMFLYEIIGTTRNYLFFALPMMMIGTMYDKWKDEIPQFKWLFIPLWIILLIEVGMYYKYKVKAMDFLLTLPLLSMLTFYWINESHQSFIQKTIPATLSLGIYLCHPYAIRMVNELLPEQGFYDWLLKYPIICFLTLILWWLMDQINKKLTYFF